MPQFKNRAFISHSHADRGGGDRLLYQLDADGELGIQRTEPIAADVRPGEGGKNNARPKLLSPLCDPRVREAPGQAR